MKKVLFYNWIEFDDPLNRGGGVTVYQKNIIEKIIEDKDIEVSFFSAGRSYDVKDKKLRIIKQENIYGDRCKSFVIINSPILAPAALSFNDIKTYLYDETLNELLEKFIIKQGGYDIIHFNNMEGLTLNVLKLKEKFPTTRFIFSLHNYYMFCPQVNLWKQDKNNCAMFNEGKECIKCMPDNLIKKKIIRKLSMAYSLKQNPSKIKKQVYDVYGKILDLIYTKPRIDTKAKDEYTCLFNEFRRMNVIYLNKYVDCILAVSKRVKDIAVSMGLDNDKVFVNYIGTKFAEKEIVKKQIGNNKKFNIAYLGYMRKDKGFFFLLDALKDIEDNVAKNISIKLACKINNEDVLNQITELKNKYQHISILPGYSHNDLPEILENVDLGIIPVLWEDNMPQVAIEMHALGVPVLASSLGGASELSNSNEFKYIGGNKEDFIKKLTAIFNNREKLSNYWDQCNPLKTMDQHVSELKRYYGIDRENR